MCFPSTLVICPCQMTNQTKHSLGTRVSRTKQPLWDDRFSNTDPRSQTYLTDASLVNPPLNPAWSLASMCAYACNTLSMCANCAESRVPTFVGEQWERLAHVIGAIPTISKHTQHGGLSLKATAYFSIHTHT